MNLIFTFVIRIDKRGLSEEILNDIKTRGLLIKLNKQPFVLDDNYKNRETDETKDLYIIKIRDSLSVYFKL